MIEKRQFYINGEWVDPKEGRDHHVIDPSTEEPAAVISLGGQADTDAAVAAAKAAFPGWMATPKEERIALLEKLIEIYKARAEDMAQTISMEMGAPIDMSKTQQWGAGYGHMKNFVRAAKDFEMVRPLGDHAPNDRIIYEPVGVAALITPWNWPMNQIACKVAPALAAGCTVVLKPSEIAPLSGILFAEILHEAGVPAGVFNLVNGDGPGVGQVLSSHPDIDIVSFTGSTRAGILVAKSAADTVKRVAQELGGKSPNLILADADLASAVAGGVEGCFANSGQSCDAPTRMLVPRERHDEALAIAKETAEKLVTGDPRDPATNLGPVISQVQYDKIQALIASGIQDGAILVTGGRDRPEGLSQGYYVRPTVFGGVTPDMRIAREEIFGPVMSIITWNDYETMLSEVNGLEYGLTALVVTESYRTAMETVERVEAGYMWINANGRYLGAPYGGWKSSGLGQEECFDEMLSYTRIKNVHMRW